MGGSIPCDPTSSLSVRPGSAPLCTRIVALPVGQKESSSGSTKPLGRQLAHNIYHGSSDAQRTLSNISSIKFNSPHEGGTLDRHCSNISSPCVNRTLSNSTSDELPYTSIGSESRDKNRTLPFSAMHSPNHKLRMLRRIYGCASSKRNRSLLSTYKNQPFSKNDTSLSLDGHWKLFWSNNINNNNRHPAYMSSRKAKGRTQSKLVYRA